MVVLVVVGMGRDGTDQGGFAERVDMQQLSQ